MTTSALSPNPYQLCAKLSVTARLVFETAWRVGSGKEGETMSDLGILRDPTGRPLLPGSSLKGKLRNTCERLAHALGLSACLLDTNASGVDCVSDVDYYHRVRGEYEQACSQGLQDRLRWIESHTCDICKLFGSPVQAARLKCGDGKLANDQVVVQVRDGVVLDRDSRTAVDGLKYDFEVVQPGTAFTVQFDLDNPTDRDLALLGVALFDWHAGGSLGGFTSRGLGRFCLDNMTLRGVDFTNPAQRVRYLTGLRPEDRLGDLGDWQAYFSERIQNQLQPKEK